MSGRREVDDPGAVAAATFNMTPMIDVTFQLIVVFLCSMKFRTLDQKIEAFLPKEVGMQHVPAPEAESRIDLKLRRAPGAASTSILLLGTRLGDAEGAGLWDGVQDRLRRLREKDPRMKGEIDADPEVPHADVMRALDAFGAAGVDSVTFRGTPPVRPDQTLPAR